ncbi:MULTISPECIES: molybdopterin cofactor-binding domain-containing protein [unclassified Paraburkholderia]|uniref:xanthine dehydrogenase family protein molybdopterin-binding subunit n=1 Tax=unclassified Paraburkholderia TaxID=2615204 RepID=UPI001611FC05|nr:MULTISPECIES: molybdopterin cofactor-binding domain-containing protein [unclassified Paraburkholderia]MBB5443828.1 CO/xanthine dehydrogenase Mo-binding subunit [Paraburkholderia sp. WSM4177]MBB5485045.1 CO/xanthine dehydrogenase Mo-binding subunit [Paraburkholderia sp. WSM4180]
MSDGRPFSVAHGIGPDDPARRRFLVGGSLMVSFAIVPGMAALAQTTTEAGTFTASAPKLPGSLKSTPLLDAWIKVGRDGQVSVFTGKAELGTGIRTALLQVAAEELDLAPHAIELITADTAATPNEGYTAGSHTMADSGTAILNAAAQVRALLVASAASQLGVDAAALTTRDGAVIAADGRRVSYGEAVQYADLHQNAQPDAPKKPPSAYALIGHMLPRVDIPGKVTGGTSYVQDLRPHGMLHARVVRPPSYGASLVAVDSGRVEALPGVIKVVRNGNYLAVVADDEWRAILAMRELALAAQWQAGPPLPDPANVHALLMSLPSQEIAVADQGAATGAAAPVATLRARYSRPYLTHGSIGPSCAVAQLDNDVMTVWTHTQGVYPLRAGIAEMLAMPPDKVRCVHVEGSGCYGHNGADDVAADAALVARELPGRPVRVQLMREQEHMWEPFGPAMTVEAHATLDSAGTLADWRYELWSNTHNNRIENAGRLLPAQLLAQPFTPAPPKPIPMPEGGGDRNSIPLYRVPGLHVRHHFVPTMPIRVSAMRSLGAHMNVFAIESFIDELAGAAHADPVAFRLKHLDDPRAHGVISAVVDQFGWRARSARTGDSSPRSHGTGFAFAQYKNLMAYLAVAMDVTVMRDTGELSIERVVAAVDCGQIVNPDGVRNQIEGGILQTTSWTLYEETHFDPQRITSYDWSTYPIMRFSSVPKRVDVLLIDRPGLPFLGVGEAAQGPAAAALANAIDDATGVRIRDLPLLGTKGKNVLKA